MIQSREDEVNEIQSRDNEVNEIDGRNDRIRELESKNEIDVLNDRIRELKSNIGTIKGQKYQLEQELYIERAARVDACTKVDRLEFDMAMTIREMTFNGLSMSMDKPVLWIKTGSDRMLPEKQMSLLYRNLRDRYPNIKFMFITPNTVDLTEMSMEDLSELGLCLNKKGKVIKTWKTMQKAGWKSIERISRHLRAKKLSR